MLDHFLTVGQQALILFILILVGFTCGKTKLVSREALKDITNLTLYIIFPCTLISAFQLELTPETLHSFLIALAAALGIHAFFFFFSWLVIREKNEGRRRILTLSCIFSNCNFMAFPLQTALLGSMGIFYGSAYALVTALVFWTGGVAYLEGNIKSLGWKKALLNPGIIGIAVGLFFFLSGITLPSVLNGAVNYLASMAVPLPMIMIGVQLSGTDLRDVFRDKMNWLAASLRLLLLPLIALGALCLFGIRGNVLVATIIAASAPAGTIVYIIAQLNGKEPKLAAELVSFQTLLSILTMPLIVALAQVVA